MTRLACIAVLVAALATVAPAGSGATDLLPIPGQDQLLPILLKLGDRMQLADEPIGCQVVERGGQVVLDCRHAGPLAKTYGIYMGERTLKVARYKSDGV